MGYKFQFVTLSAFHPLDLGRFTLPRENRERGVIAHAELQNAEFEAQALGYETVRRQRFVGTGTFDEVSQVVTGGLSSTLEMAGSTEAEQFHAVSSLGRNHGIPDHPS